ncbi:MAG TPA: hypothetical protein ACFYED_04150 [Candidatus Tripitaka californicus]
MFRLWGLAQASSLRVKKPTPGKAVGLAFIPFYNFYWVFILFRNLALHLNHLAGPNKVPIPQVTGGCILLVSSVVLEFGGQIIPQVTGRHALLRLLLGSTIFGFVGWIVLLIINFDFYRSARELVTRSA